MLSTAPPRLGTHRQPLQLLLLFVAVTGTLLAGAAPASAHAALTGSDPKQGSVVQRAPEQVTLRFSEKVAMSDDAVRVLDPAGKRVDTGTLRDLSGGGVIKYGVALRSGLPDGTFTVAWKAVSADSHPISGAFSFSIGAPSETSVQTPQEGAGGGAVGLLYGIARYLSYAGFIVVVGGAAFVLACWPRGAGVRPVQRLVVRGWLTLTGATLAMLLLRGPYTDSGGLADVLDLGSVGEVLNTKTGAALVSRLLLLAAAALFIAVLFGAYAKRDAAEEDELQEGDAPGEGADPEAGPEDDPKTDPETRDGAEERDSGETRDGAEKLDGEERHSAEEKRDLAFGLAIGGGVVAAGIASTWALSEHASTGIQTALAMPVDVLHLLAAALWLGGLAALLVALHRAPTVGPIERGAVRRFSTVAFSSVVTLAATGTYQSWRQVGSWSALFGTAYGQLLLAKLGLIAVLVGFASISRRWTARLAETRRAAGASMDAQVVEQRTATDEPEPVTVPARTADAVREATAKAETEEPASRGERGDGTDTRRAAQLARQRAAKDNARERRLREADPERAGLRRSVLAEAAVAVLLLAVTTVLTSTEPGRTQEQVDRSVTSTGTGTAAPDGPVSLTLPFDTGGPDGKGTVRLELDPGRTGSNTLHLYAERPGGEAFDLPEVKVALTLKAKDIGPLPVIPDPVTSGHWSSGGVQVPMAGDWQISVTVRTSEIDQVTVHKNVKIG